MSTTLTAFFMQKNARNCVKSNAQKIDEIDKDVKAFGEGENKDALQAA